VDAAAAATIAAENAWKIYPVRITNTSLLGVELLHNKYNTMHFNLHIIQPFLFRTNMHE